MESGLSGDAGVPVISHVALERGPGYVYVTILPQQVGEHLVQVSPTKHKFVSLRVVQVSWYQYIQ